MRETSGRTALLSRKDGRTVHFARRVRPESVTVCVPGAALAPAPTSDPGEAAESPVFVDDSGGRKRILRLAGVLVGLLSVTFLGLVGVALAVPSVATSVGLGNVVPFVVPNAAAAPPKATPAPRAVEHRPTPVVTVTTEPKPVDKTPPTWSRPTTPPAPPTAAAPPTSAPPTSAPPTSTPPTSTPPVWRHPGQGLGTTGWTGVEGTGTGVRNVQQGNGATTATTQATAQK